MPHTGGRPVDQPAEDQHAREVNVVVGGGDQSRPYLDQYARDLRHLDHLDAPYRYQPPSKEDEEIEAALAASRNEDADLAAALAASAESWRETEALTRDREALRRQMCSDIEQRHRREAAAESARHKRTRVEREVEQAHHYNRNEAPTGDRVVMELVVTLLLTMAADGTLCVAETLRRINVMRCASKHAWVLCMERVCRAVSTGAMRPRACYLDTELSRTTLGLSLKTCRVYGVPTLPLDTRALVRGFAGEHGSVRVQAMAPEARPARGYTDATTTCIVSGACWCVTAAWRRFVVERWAKMAEAAGIPKAEPYALRDCGVYTREYDRLATNVANARARSSDVLDALGRWHDKEDEQLKRGYPRVAARS